MAERRERCETCRFWSYDENGDCEVELGDEDAHGGCHRYPPVIDPNATLLDNDDPLRTSVPQVYCWEWCGEWQSADDSSP